VSQYLRLFAGELATLAHYQQVSEVGEWLSDGRIPREAVWRGMQVPVVALATRFGQPAAAITAYVVVEAGAQRIMLLVDRIEALVDVDAMHFQPVLNEEVLPDPALDQACYIAGDDRIYWRLDPAALVADTLDG